MAGEFDGGEQWLRDDADESMPLASGESEQMVINPTSIRERIDVTELQRFFVPLCLTIHDIMQEKLSILGDFKSHKERNPQLSRADVIAQLSRY